MAQVMSPRIPAQETAIRATSSWHGIVAAAHRVCDRYGLPKPLLSFEELWFNFFFVQKGERWLFV
jgi:hypothetical protein